MAADRVEDSDLALSFPFDTGRGVTTAVADFICLTLTKQAFGVLYGSGHYTVAEDSIIDSSECHGIIAGAATRICEELWQSVHRRRPVPLYIFTEEEKESIEDLQEMTFISAESDD